MAGIYTTIQGDTWDMIAKKVYDDEAKLGLLMENNFAYMDIFIFEAGITLYVPDLEEEEEEDLPEWRYDDEEEEEE